MTDLIDRPRLTPGDEPADGARGGDVLRGLAAVPRLWWARCVAAGFTAAGTALTVCLVLALVGWFAAEEGRYGDTRDALRVGADAWLLSLGSGLRLPDALVGVVPWGLTLLTALVAYRAGRSVPLAEGDDPDDPDDAGHGVLHVLGGTVVMALAGAVTALVVAVAATSDAAAPGLLRAGLGGLLVVGLGAGLGLLRGSSAVGEAVRERTPSAVTPLVAGAGAVVLLTLALAAALLAVGLGADLPDAASMYSRMHLDVGDGTMFSLVVLAFVPNAVLLSSSYLLGSGFSLGVGTAVSPAATTLGPLPAFPLVVALPGTGPADPWLAAIVGVPVLGAAVATFCVQRRRPAAGVLGGAWQGLGAGLLAAVALVALQLLAGGAAGPGRMAEVSVLLGPSLLIALGSLGGGGLLGGLVGAWVCRGRADSDDTEEALDEGDEPTVELDLRGR